MTTTTSYASIFLLASGERTRNAQRFATREEAEQSAFARFLVWTQPTGYEVDETNDPVNFRFFDGKDESLWNVTLWKGCAT